MMTFRPYTKQYRLVLSRREMTDPTDDDVAALIEWLENAPSNEWNGPMLHRAAASLEQLRDERDFARTAVATKCRQHDSDMVTMRDALNREIARAEAAEARCAELEQCQIEKISDDDLGELDFQVAQEWARRGRQG